MPELELAVIVPSCDRPSQLYECLSRLRPEVQSLQKEKYEVIVTDDSVTKECQKVADQFAGVRWTGGPRRGPAANRNHGASQTRADWLVLTDDDCLPAPGWLDAYARNRRPGTLIYEGKTTCEAGVRSPRQHAPQNLSGGRLWTCNLMIERAFFESVGRFDENFEFAHLEDIDLRRRMLQSGVNWQFVEQAIVDHPPRIRGFGWQLAKLRKSDVYFRLKHGQDASLKALVREIIRGRVSPMLRYRASMDTLVAMISTVIEITYVACLHRKWNSECQATVSRLKST